MIQVIKSENRGRTKIAWLDSYHTFSFSEYFNRNMMHFGPLRVLNEDFIEPDSGFPTHPHNNMEIITYVLAGALEHRDSTGTHSVIQAGDLQKMTAGSGVFHSEFNPSKVEAVHLFQIWIMPEVRELTPSYQQVTLDKSKRKNTIQLVASNAEAAEVIHVQQDVQLYLADLDAGQQVTHQLTDGRGVFLQAISGEILVNENALVTGDAIEIAGVAEIIINAKTNSEILLFDVKL